MTLYNCMVGKWSSFENFFVSCQFDYLQEMGITLKKMDWKQAQTVGTMKRE